MGDRMNLLTYTVMQEKQRIEYMLNKYREELKSLPKGTIYEKSVDDKIYYYLKYRKGKKVISEYIAKSNIENIKTQLEKRKHIEAMIKSLLEEKSIADKILEGKK